eukprot:1131731-Lingulodinium_polyedra.AAC.1
MAGARSKHCWERASSTPTPSPRCEGNVDAIEVSAARPRAQMCECACCAMRAPHLVLNGPG